MCRYKKLLEHLGLVWVRGRYGYMTETKNGLIADFEDRIKNIEQHLAKDKTFKKIDNF